jgi:serine/threonine protein kinase
MSVIPPAFSIIYKSGGFLPLRHCGHLSSHPSVHPFGSRLDSAAVFETFTPPQSTSLHSYVQYNTVGSRPRDSRDSRCATWVGTVTYMSPERIMGNDYSFNSDVWALGVIVVECALGHYPYCKNPCILYGLWELLSLSVPWGTIHTVRTPASSYSTIHAVKKPNVFIFPSFLDPDRWRPAVCARLIDCSRRSGVSRLID